VSGPGDATGELTAGTGASALGPWNVAPQAAFCHHGLLFEGEQEYLEAATQFALEGSRQGDQVFVMGAAMHLDALRRQLGSAQENVEFLDTGSTGVNPARVMPLWQGLMESVEPGRAVRGIAQPVTEQGRVSAAAERSIYESLLNVTFAERRPFWLQCPNDVAALGADTIEGLGSSHQFLSRGNGWTTEVSNTYRFPDPDGAFGRSATIGLEAPPDDAERFSVGRDQLGELRRRVRAVARSLGLTETAASDFALAVHEVVANSIRHGGGVGNLALWHDDGELVCDVTDTGTFDSPMAGRVRPSPEARGGRGLWMANQICDLVQIRSVPGRTVVRLHLGF
jgi:anti-sigma regulatory factor (Ser/Thr protein kinase)